ncbi:hypothetical protein OG21DRAFT_1607513 [Imleria badia]|nr:hypothetical protein OG21DRAFT_1607513 [Imleria badia]
MATPEPVFPAEIFCNVLRYSSPKDVIRWRAVSKWFHATTYDASIWRYLYANSRLPRPPGPFSSQSTAYLEQVLVRTERLAHSWITGPMQDVSHVEVGVEQQPSGSLFGTTIRLLGGRWLVGCESETRFVLHDIYPNSESRRQVIWESEHPVETWDACSVTSEEGQCRIYVLFDGEDPEIMSWVFVEFCMDGESGKPCGVTPISIPSGSEFEVSDEWLHAGKSPFIYISDMLVFDTRTRIFYEFPEFLIALDETRYSVGSDFTVSQIPSYVLLTSTHILALYKDLDSHSQFPVTLIQAFTVPSIRNGKGVLRLSHEGVSEHHFDEAALLRNSIVDSITGTTNVRLLVHLDVNHGLNVTWGDLTLLKPSGNDVLPMTIVMNEEFRKHKKPYKRLSPRDCCFHIDCSEGGHLRGFCIDDSSSKKNLPVMKFTVDVTQEECTLEIGEFLRPNWRHIKDPKYRSSCFLDAASGRFGFIKTYRGEKAIVPVVDIE